MQRLLTVSFAAQGERGHHTMLWTGASSTECNFVGRLKVFDTTASSGSQHALRLKLNGSVSSIDCDLHYFVTEDAVDYEDYYTKVRALHH